MSRTVPSPGTLRHLLRLCEFEIHKPTTPRRSKAASTCKYAAVGLSKAPRYQFTSCATQFKASALADRIPRPEIDHPPPSSSTVPDISSYYTLFPQTIPKGPPPSGPFRIPGTLLRKEFLSLQSLHHPDKYTSSPAAHQKSLALSALINTAYKTLMDPLLRAQYLLQHKHDIDVTTEDNSSHATDQATLMEVMEVQEAFEQVGADSQGQDQIEELKEANKKRIRDAEEKMGTAFEQADIQVAKDECVRLNYWRSLQQGLDDWEPGKEVRLVH